MKFSDIKTTKQLVSYLNSTSRQQKSFFHYTTLTNLNLIRSSKLFYLSSFYDTNDVYEAESIDDEIKKDTFIGCFSRNESESVAMWYMYANPHEEGIRIEIKPEYMKKWMDELQKNRTAFIIENNIPENTVSLEKVRVHTIAYFEPMKKKFYWSNVQLFCNDHQALLDFNSDKITHGYIKHAAWEYEEEMRLSIKIKNDENIKKIAIKVPDFVIDNMIIMTGPNFNHESSSNIRFEKSILFKKINLKT